MGNAQQSQRAIEYASRGPFEFILTIVAIVAMILINAYICPSTRDRIRALEVKMEADRAYYATQRQT